jgi:hypothetical protein
MQVTLFGMRLFTLSVDERTTRGPPIATELGGVNMRLNPGGIREVHWHKEAEWPYMTAGDCRIACWMRSVAVHRRCLRRRSLVLPGQAAVFDPARS